MKGVLRVERVLKEGDYVPDGAGGIQIATGGGEVLARVVYRLTARRGGFPFLPELGSRLYKLGREKPAERQALCAQYVAEALREETEIKVRSVKLETFDGWGKVTVELDWQGERLTAQASV